MAVSLNPLRADELIDPFEGEADLRAGTIRVIRSRSFEEDPTRAFRAVRYRSRFGFRYAEETEAEFGHAREHMGSLSFRRVKNELLRIALEESRADMVREIDELGLLRAFHSSLTLDRNALPRLESSMQGLHEGDWVLFFALFMGTCTLDPGDLELTREERKVLLDVCRWRDRDLPDDLGELHRDLQSVRDVSIRVLQALRPDRSEMLDAYMKRRRDTRLRLRGADLLDLGVREGKEMGEVLQDLFRAKLRGEVSDEGEAAFVRSWMKRRRGD
jgi:tRNA nucleotidyltransferase/poly(A) polymerase